MEEPMDTTFFVIALFLREHYGVVSYIEIISTFNVSNITIILNKEFSGTTCSPFMF